MRPTVDRYATDSWPICHRQLTDIPPTADRYTTDSWPTYHRQLTDIPPTYDRYSVEMRRRNIDRYSADGLSLWVPNVGRRSLDSRPPLDRQSADGRSTDGRLSSDCRSTVDQLSTAIVSTAIAVDIAVDITYSKHDPKSNFLKIWLEKGEICKTHLRHDGQNTDLQSWRLPFRLSTIERT